MKSLPMKPLASPRAYYAAIVLLPKKADRAALRDKAPAHWHAMINDYVTSHFALGKHKKEKNV